MVCLVKLTGPPGDQPFKAFGYTSWSAFCGWRIHQLICLLRLTGILDDLPCKADGYTGDLPFDADWYTRWSIFCMTNDHGYVPLVVSSSRLFPRSRLITEFVTRLTRRVSLSEQQLLTLRKHLSSPPVFSGDRVTRSLVLCVCFVDHCLSFCAFSFGHSVVCSSSIYGLWLPLWYLQTLLLKLNGNEAQVGFHVLSETGRLLYRKSDSKYLQRQAS